MDDHVHLVAVASQGFVNGVIHHLKYHVMQTGAVIGIANVHPRPFAHGIQPFQDFNTRRVVSLLTHSVVPLDEFGALPLLYVVGQCEISCSFISPLPGFVLVLRPEFLAQHPQYVRVPRGTQCSLPAARYRSACPYRYW